MAKSKWGQSKISIQAVNAPQSARKSYSDPIYLSASGDCGRGGFRAK